MMNIASPAAALRWRKLPCAGIGLARMEFIIINAVKVHPMACAEFDAIEDEDVRERIETITSGDEDKAEYFVRTLAEADRVLEAMKEEGLERGARGLKVYVMAEIPSNVVLAEKFAERFDGFSIGSNDLTQLVLGIDRGSELLAESFDERDEAVKEMIRLLIERAHEAGRPVGICGQAPSDHPDFAAFLVECGIDSISLNPDSVVRALRRVAEVEAKRNGSKEDD